MIKLLLAYIVIWLLLIIVAAIGVLAAFGLSELMR